MPEESAPGERVDLVTICFPPEDSETPEETPAAGGTKPEGFGMRNFAQGLLATPLSSGFFYKKPLRPVVLRPHLSAGLPLNSVPTMRRKRAVCKELFCSTHQKQGFRVLHGLGGAAHHHHIALFEDGVRARVPADDALTPHRAYRGPRTAGR